MKNSEKPAYPIQTDWDDVQKKLITTTEKQGLTKREYFAAMVLQGLAVNFFDKKLSNQAESIGSNISVAMAISAVDLADELLKQLEK